MFSKANKDVLHYVSTQKIAAFMLSCALFVTYAYAFDAYTENQHCLWRSVLDSVSYEKSCGTASPLIFLVRSGHSVADKVISFENAIVNVVVSVVFGTVSVSMASISYRLMLWLLSVAFRRVHVGYIKRVVAPAISLDEAEYSYSEELCALRIAHLFSIVAVSAFLVCLLDLRFEYASTWTVAVPVVLYILSVVYLVIRVIGHFLYASALVARISGKVIDPVDQLKFVNK